MDDANSRARYWLGFLVGRVRRASSQNDKTDAQMQLSPLLPLEQLQIETDQR